MAGVAVLAAQHVAVDAQADADAGAPGDVGAVVAALQRAPAALGLQRGDRVVLDPHVREALLAAAPRSAPSARCWAARAPGRRCRRRCSARPARPCRRAARRGRQDETPTRSTAPRSMPCSSQASSISRRICTASASLAPVLAVGSLRRPISGDALSAERLTATLVPPMSTQALMGSNPSRDQGRDHAEDHRAGDRQLPLATEGTELEIAGQAAEADAPQPVGSARSSAAARGRRRSASESSAQFRASTAASRASGRPPRAPPAPAGAARAWPPRPPGRRNGCRAAGLPSR